MADDNSYEGIGPAQSDEVKRRAAEFRKQYGSPTKGFPEKGLEEGDLADYAVMLPMGRAAGLARRGATGVAELAGRKLFTEAAEEAPSVGRGLVSKLASKGLPEAEAAGASAAEAAGGAAEAAETGGRKISNISPLSNSSQRAERMALKSERMNLNPANPADKARLAEIDAKLSEMQSPRVSE